MKEEILQVLVKADDCLENAKYLFKGHFYLGTVNRAYYAIFNYVQAILFTKQIFTKTHQGCHSKFNELFIKTKIFPKEFAEKLNEAFELRQSGDYDMNTDIGEEEAKASIENAENFCKMIKNYIINQQA